MPTPQRRNAWKWFFAVLAALTVLATVVPIVYNLKQQLKPEQFAAAWDQWKHQRPANYVMTYEVRKNDEEHGDRFVVTVKDGKTRSVLCNGLALQEDKFAYYGMDRLFDQLDQTLQKDRKENTKTYLRGIFDEKTGAIRWFVRRVMGTRERLEITVKPIEEQN